MSAQFPGIEELRRRVEQIRTTAQARFSEIRSRLGGGVAGSSGILGGKLLGAGGIIERVEQTFPAVKTVRTEGILGLPIVKRIRERGILAGFGTSPQIVKRGEYIQTEAKKVEPPVTEGAHY